VYWNIMHVPVFSAAFVRNVLVNIQIVILNMWANTSRLPYTAGWSKLLLPSGQEYFSRWTERPRNPSWHYMWKLIATFSYTYNTRVCSEMTNYHFGLHAQIQIWMCTNYYRATRAHYFKYAVSATASIWHNFHLEKYISRQDFRVSSYVALVHKAANEQSWFSKSFGLRNQMCL
jgi:hypothetical protein